MALILGKTEDALARDGTRYEVYRVFCRREKSQKFYAKVCVSPLGKVYGAELLGPGSVEAAQLLQTLMVTDTSIASMLKVSVMGPSSLSWLGYASEGKSVEVETPPSAVELAHNIARQWAGNLGQEPLIQSVAGFLWRHGRMSRVLAVCSPLLVALGVATALYITARMIL